MNFETFDTGCSRTSGIYLHQISIAAKDSQIVDELLAQQNIEYVVKLLKRSEGGG